MCRCKHPRFESSAGKPFENREELIMATQLPSKIQIINPVTKKYTLVSIKPGLVKEIGRKKTAYKNVPVIVLDDRKY